ncbi:hypothetical protein CY34DRAFT_802686, partial [Suillus luteus UH-Slu-Lm8-n1]
MHGNRRHIPEAAKQQWVTMSTRGMTSKAIAQVTGSSLRTVNRAVVQRPVESGRPRLLTSQDKKPFFDGDKETISLLLVPG